LLLGVRCDQVRDPASGVLPMRELVTADGQRVSLAGEGHFFLNRQGEIVTREVSHTTQLGLRVRLWLAGC
jgi:hypothetical protein